MGIIKIKLRNYEWKIIYFYFKLSFLIINYNTKFNIMFNYYFRLTNYNNLLIFYTNKNILDLNI